LQKVVNGPSSKRREYHPERPCILFGVWKDLLEIDLLAGNPVQHTWALVCTD
jgi:hypothetical protein